MSQCIEYTVSFNKTKIQLDGDGDRLIFECNPNTIFPTDRADFAAWALLPIAMRKGKNLRIMYRGSEATAKNAIALSRIWSMWLPHVFRPIEVSFSENVDFKLDARDKSGVDLLLYSGGVNSTYNLIRRHQEGLKQVLLTVHGLDYKLSDFNGFNELIKQTEPIANQMAEKRLFLETNAYSQYKKHGIKADLSHGFILAASVFLMGRSYDAGVISADFSRDQEFLAFPWGTNSVTNDYFSSGDFRLRTENLDVTRGQKMELLSKYPSALQAITFCSDSSNRPKNCGLCSKCVRTKVMFIAATGKVPDIFNNSAISKKYLNALNLNKRSERAFFADIIALAESNKHVDKIPGLKKKIADSRSRPFNWSRLAKFLLPAHKK
jgi:hypothetical protein